MGFSSLSYKFIIGDFLEFEEHQNLNNTHTLLQSMDTTVGNIYKLVNDYSKWDDSYDFVLNQNQNYIYENYRKETTTLENLNVDFIIYANKTKDVLFSKYNDKTLDDDKTSFEKYLLNRFQKENRLSTVTTYKSYYLYLVKLDILRSDHTGDVTGWIYSGKIITDKTLNSILESFETVKKTTHVSPKGELSLTLPYLKNIKIKTDLTSTYLKNSIQFYDNTDKFIFSVDTKNKREIVNNGEKTILWVNLIVAIFLLILFYIFYKNQLMLMNYNKKLQINVAKKTNKLTKSLLKIKQQNKELYELSHTDSLTKIKNRRSYFKESEKLRQKAMDEKQNFSVLMIDIDHFKKINDTYGHAIGDAVLIEFCGLINSVIKDEVFGRIGGEEFCITFFGKTENEMNLISEEIRKLCEKNILKIDDKSISFTISIGLTFGDSFASMDEILQSSDELLYKAKKEGRNCVRKA